VSAKHVAMKNVLYCLRKTRHSYNCRIFKTISSITFKFNTMKICYSTIT